MICTINVKKVGSSPLFEVVTADNGDGGVEEGEGTYVYFFKKDCSKVTWFGSIIGQYLAMEMSNLAYNSLYSVKQPCTPPPSTHPMVVVQLVAICGWCSCTMVSCVYVL